MAAPPNSRGLSTQGLEPEVRKVVEALSPVLGEHMLKTSTALDRSLTLAQNLDCQIHTFKLAVPSEWQSVTFGTDWQQWGTDTVRYRKSPDGTRIELDGMADSTGAGVATSIFTLPATYWPASAQVRVTNSNSTIARVDISAAGVVTYVSGDRTQWFNLANIWFVPANQNPIAPSCYPYNFQCTTKGKPKLVEIGAVDDAQDNTKIIAYATPNWSFYEKDGKRMVRIKYIPFLTPGRTYTVTVAVYGG
jgi:hypothetical protein